MMLSMIEEAWRFGGSQVALCGEGRESQTKPIWTPSVLAIESMGVDYSGCYKSVHPNNLAAQPSRPLIRGAS